MSINGSMKESIFSIYLKSRQKIIEETLGFEVDYLALEQKHGSRHIDLKCVDKKRRVPILFEIQLTPANKSYLKRIKKMVSTTQEGVIVWVALSFDEIIMTDLKQWLKHNQTQYVDFYALSINEQVLPVLAQLNEMYKLDILKNLPLLEEIEPILSIALQSKQIPTNHCGHLNVEPAPLNYDNDQDLKRGLLLHLRRTIPQFLNFHYDKKANQYDKILNVGAGKYGVVYRCSAKDRREKAFVELYFDKFIENEYEAFKLQKSLLQKVIHPEITFEKRRIGVYFKPASTHEMTFELIADIFKRMIDVFSQYFYGDKQIETLDVFANVESTPEKLKPLFMSMPVEMQELEFATEDSYKIWLEEIGEQLLYR